MITFRQFAIASFVLAFGSPWIHRLMFENLCKAIPGINLDNAHGWAITFSVAVIVGALIITGNGLWAERDNKIESGR